MLGQILWSVVYLTAAILLGVALGLIGVWQVIKWDEKQMRTAGVRTNHDEGEGSVR